MTRDELLDRAAFYEKRGMDIQEEYLAAIERLHNCEYPDNSPEFLEPAEAESRMRDLWFVFNYDHPSS
jgi:hypothetical protein